MRTKIIFLSMTLLVAFMMAACSPQAGMSDSMIEKEPGSEMTTDKMEEDMASDPEKSDDAMAGESMPDDEMSTTDDDMVVHDGDSMMAEDEVEKDDDSDAMMAEKDDSMGADKDSTEMDDAMDGPTWFTTQFTEARTGEVFQIADFKGKVILVETLAMWCSNCLKQQEQVKELHNQLGEREDFISLGIDIDPNENTEALKGYIDNNGFNWHYTVAPVDAAREIGQLYGDQYLNPPSTPMLIIDRDGGVHLLPFGIKNAENLLAALEPFLEGEM